VYAKPAALAALINDKISSFLGCVSSKKDFLGSLANALFIRFTAGFADLH
jgi:hypothetical protein